MSLPTTGYVENRPIWDDGNPRPLPTLDGDATADVCVIGLGASGLCAVLEALTLGRTVVGIDATVTAGGAAGANGGILRAGISTFHHDAVAALGRDRATWFYDRSAAEIDQIVTETPEAIQRTGSMRIASDDTEWADCQAQASALRADGIDCQERDTLFGRGLFISRDASVQPVVRGRALTRLATAGGARLFEQTRAVSFSPGVVRTPRGRVSCDSVVIAVDGGLEELVPSLVGVARTTRLQMLATAPARDVTIACPVSANGGFDYWQQLPDGRIALGGGRDRAMEREWGAPAEPSDEIQRYLDSVLRDRIGTKSVVTHRWAARVAYTQTSIPVLAEVEHGVWATGAYSGTGNLLGAIYGRAAARLACGDLRDVPEMLRQPVNAAAC